MNSKFIIECLMSVINISLIMYIAGLLYKDNLTNMINVDPLENIIVLTIISAISTFSWTTSLFLVIAYILTIVSLYKNNNDNIQSLLNNIIRIPEQLLSRVKAGKENMDPLNKVDVMNRMGTSQLDSSITVCPENVHNKSAVIQTNLLQELAKTQIDGSKCYKDKLTAESDEYETGFVVPDTFQASA